MEVNTCIIVNLLLRVNVFCRMTSVENEHGNNYLLCLEIVLTNYCAVFPPILIIH